MTLTTTQVAEKLGVKANTTVLRLVREGLLVPTNKRKDGAKKFFAKFNSKDVNEYIAKNGRPRARSSPIKKANITPTPITGIGTQFKEIQQKLDRLQETVDTFVKLWS